ncbi:hypothetical protein AAH991_08465 [Microbispora sp. ZYX-F-249]|uniref:Uncharacterized protein n=1 Tax=Microbispora maris TaxID=3144104 RepID=A0ABV0AIH4_9ACTN
MAFAEKLLFVPPPIQVSGHHVKRYHVTADPAGVDPEIEDGRPPMKEPRALIRGDAPRP